MARVIGLLTFLGISLYGQAQQLAVDRITAWQNAGPTNLASTPTTTVNILNFGADNDGDSDCTQAIEAAISSLNGTAGIIYFPAGEYLFETSINLPDSVWLKGESTETVLQFDLGGTGHCILMNGSISSQERHMFVSATKGDYQIELADASELESGDYIRLSMFDEDYMYSTWAYGTLGQLVQISEVDGNTLYLADPLNHHYPISRNPVVKKVTPRVAAGIECLKITREDETSGQTDNIRMTYATNCVVRNIESIDCNYGHVNMRTCSHNLIEKSYFHHAHSYGGGGQGYGVVSQATSCYNLVEDNIFEHLRHSMILQSGANANVFGYNYSYDPYWEDGFLPANSAGDAVLHGNYTTMNLFEGNVVQHIVVDASHGSNGPFNTFFRNRAELYGFFSDPNTVTDSMNIVGNEITNEGFLLGLFMLNGDGHYSYGNNHRGTVTPSGTSNMVLNTLYLNEAALPDFLNNESLPMIGYPLAMNEKNIPAEIRFQNEDYIGCSSSIVTDLEEERTEESTIFINGSILNLSSSLLPATLNVYNTGGQLVLNQQISSQQTELPAFLSNGVYIVQCISTNEINNIKVLISR